MGADPTISRAHRRSLLKRARTGDTAAIERMFRQFLDPAESVMHAEYLGVQGFWGIGTRCFGCVTDRRVCALRVGFLGKVVYQDGYLEDANSNLVLQPGLVGLLVLSLVFLVGNTAVPLFVSRAFHAEYYREFIYLVGIPVLLFILGFLLLPVLVQLYYRFNKSGLIWVIREGVAVYFFTNRKRLSRAARIYRVSADIREHRIQYLKRAAEKQVPPPEFSFDPGPASTAQPADAPPRPRAGLAKIFLLWMILGAALGAGRIGLDFGLARATNFAFDRGWHTAGDALKQGMIWLAFPAPMIWKNALRERLVAHLRDLEENRGRDFIQAEAAGQLAEALQSQPRTDIWDILYGDQYEQWDYLSKKYPDLLETLFPESEADRLFYLWLLAPPFALAFLAFIIHAATRPRPS